MDRLILILVFFYFALPKYDLLFIPGSLTGFRIQDLISLVLFLSVFDGKITRNNLLIILLLIIHCFYSIAIWNNNLSFLGLIRLFEYYAVGLGILHLVNIRKFNFFFTIILLYLGLLSALQYFLVIPNLDPGRGLLYNRAFSGSFGTPAELSYFLISVLFLFNKINEKIGISSYFSLFVLLNGVTAPLLGFLSLYWDHIRRINYLLGLLIVVSLLLVIYISRDIFLIGLDFLFVVVENITTRNATFAELKMGSGIDVGSETLSMRIGKWTTSLSLLYQYPIGLIFGFGIYSQGGALDGGILRLLFEFGFLFFSFIVFLMARTSLIFLIILLCVNLFFDAYMSSVVMPILIATYLFLRNKKSSSAVINSSV